MAEGNGNTGTIVTTVLKWQKIGYFSLFGYEVRTAGHKTAQIKKKRHFNICWEICSISGRLVHTANGHYVFARHYA